VFFVFSLSLELLLRGERFGVTHSVLRVFLKFRVAFEVPTAVDFYCTWNSIIVEYGPIFLFFSLF
jgi:hypothetical protein